MKTRSVKSSQVSALGSRSGEAEDDAAVGVDRQPPRAGVAELQPGRGRAGSAVEQEGHRPGARVGAIELVGGVGDVGLRLALVVEQPDRAGGGGEVQRAAREAPACAWWSNPAAGDAARRPMAGWLAAAAPAPALLARRRRRCSGLLLRRRFGVFGTSAEGESDSEERDQHAQAARSGKTDSHVHYLRRILEVAPNRF